MQSVARRTRAQTSRTAGAEIDGVHRPAPVRRAASAQSNRPGCGRRKRTASVADLARTAPAHDAAASDSPTQDQVSGPQTLDDEDDEDEVVVVNNVRPRQNGASPRRSPSPGPASSNDSDIIIVEQQAEDDDVVVLSQPPAKRARSDNEGSMESGDDELGDDEDLRVVGDTGQVVTRDLPHPRPDCAEHRFAREGAASNSMHCDKCFCYVCDVKASECGFWGTGTRERDHANALPHPVWSKLLQSMRAGNTDLIRREFQLSGPLKPPKRRSARSLSPVPLLDEPEAPQSARPHRYQLRSRDHRPGPAADGAGPSGAAREPPAPPTIPVPMASTAASAGGSSTLTRAAAPAASHATPARNAAATTVSSALPGGIPAAASAAAPAAASAAASAAALRLPVVTARSSPVITDGPALRRLEPLLMLHYPRTLAMIKSCNQLYKSYKLPVDLLNSRKGRHLRTPIYLPELGNFSIITVTFEHQEKSMSATGTSIKSQSDAKQLAAAAALEKLLVEEKVPECELYPPPPGYVPPPPGQAAPGPPAPGNGGPSQAAATSQAPGRGTSAQAAAGQAAGQPAAGQGASKQPASGAAGQGASGSGAGKQPAPGQPAPSQPTSGQSATKHKSSLLRPEVAVGSGYGQPTGYGSSSLPTPGPAFAAWGAWGGWYQAPPSHWQQGPYGGPQGSWPGQYMQPQQPYPYQHQQYPPYYPQRR